MRQHIANLPDKDLAYFEEGNRHFDDYVEAVGWADFAQQNRALMMRGDRAATPGDPQAVRSQPGGGRLPP
ncbi:RtcB family protein [Pseudomonas aeruginosa]|nr:RtcB family protein [Pseudomonas aeruginosa]